MDLNKLGQMLGSGNEDFLVEDAIFLTEKAKDFLRSRSGFHYQFEIIVLESFFVIMV